jgi:hypothetical protein
MKLCKNCSGAANKPEPWTIMTPSSELQRGFADILSIATAAEMIPVTRYHTQITTFQTPQGSTNATNFATVCPRQILGLCAPLGADGEAAHRCACRVHAK